MRTMTALEYSYIIQNELSQIVGKHFDKIYDAGENKFRIKIGADITCEVGVRINLSKYIEKTDELGGFSKKIRKELHGSKLLKIYQYNSDRVIVFEFTKGNLVFEMFGKGNIVLYREGIVIAALKNESWSDREIRAKKEYKFPKTKTVEKLPDKLPEKYIISVLMTLPLGKPYALEILSKCGIEEKKQSNELSKKERNCVVNEIEKIKGTLTPYGFYDGENLVDYGLVKFRDEFKQFNTLSEVIDDYYQQERKAESPGLEKLDRRLQKQYESLERMKKEEEEKKKIAEYMKENYEKFEELLNAAKKAGINNVESLLKNYKVKVNKEKKEIEIEI